VGGTTAGSAAAAERFITFSAHDMVKSMKDRRAGLSVTVLGPAAAGGAAGPLGMGVGGGARLAVDGFMSEGSPPVLETRDVRTLEYFSLSHHNRWALRRPPRFL